MQVLGPAVLDRIDRGAPFVLPQEVLDEFSVTSVCVGWPRDCATDPFPLGAQASKGSTVV